MEQDEYKRMYQVEDHHWWYAGMAAITRAMLNRYISPRTNLDILDAGCGTGAALSTYLADYGKGTGFDRSPLALKYCQARNIKTLALASVMEIPFQSHSFDLVTSFDVLYERAVPNDGTALAEFFRVLRPNGYLLVRLPAYNWLRGQHDLAIHTARRYTAREVAGLFKKSGFHILHISYGNTLLFPLAAAKRVLERLWPPAPDSSDLSVEFGIFNGLFQYILSSEAPVVAHPGLPFGLSVFALGQKPNSA